MIENDSQDNPIIPISGFSFLKTAAWILIILGIIETIIFIDAIRSGYSFVGGAVFYIYLGYKLLRNDVKIYRRICISATILCGLGFSGLIVMVIFVFYFISIKTIPIEYNIDSVLPIVLICYSLLLPIFISLLHHPETRKAFSIDATGGSIKTLFLSHKRFVLLLVIPLIIATLLGGPHLLDNPFIYITTTIAENKQIENNIGDIKKLKLTKFTESNWHIISIWDIEGDEGNATYYVNVSPQKKVTLDIKSLKKNRQYQDNEIIEHTPPLVKDFSLKESSQQEDTLLLSTSFEKLDISIPEAIIPFLNTGNVKWQVYYRDKRSGKYSLNVIPNGNPAPKFGFFLKNKYESSALLNSVFTKKYEPFDVSKYDFVELEFWRCSTSNPDVRNEFNCGSALDVYYRTNNGEWIHKMSYCGQHKTESTGWRHSKLKFETSNCSTIEFKFQYDFPLSGREDNTVFYLIDDLQVRGHPESK